MTIRMNEEQSSKSQLPPETRSNQGPRSSNVTDEGCPVIESGSVCGETKTLAIIREFREIYDNCVQNMEQCTSDGTTMKKLEPFRKLVDNLWEQNAMLVETVQELEQEATCRVAMLQERLNQSNEKADMIQNDVCALIEVIKRFRDKGVLDPSGLNFNTVCDAEIFGKCRETCTQRICKKGDCRKRHLMLEVGQKFDAKPAPSMTLKPGPSKMSYEQREEMLKPSKADSAVLSYKQSQLSQAPSKREISNLSFQPSGMSQLSKILSSTTSYRGGSKVSQTQSHAGSLMQVSVGSQAPQHDDSQMPVDVGSQTSPSADSQMPLNADSQIPANVDSRMPVNVDSRMPVNVDSRVPVHVGSSYVSVQESNNQLRAGESTSSYERTSYMDFPSKVEISTSMEKVSTISQSTSTGFVQEDVVTKSYSKMSHHMPQQMNHMPLEFNHMRPININLKLIREPSCCITSNQCCDCDCEPDCSSCICDCEY